jgi:hypothetical protein
MRTAEATLDLIVAALRERGRMVSDCENVKTTYVGRRPKFRYCGRCPMCRIWAAIAERLDPEAQP